MAIIRNPNANANAHDENEQSVLVKSFNKEWEILEQLPMGYYSAGDCLLPFTVDTNGKLVVIVDSISISSLPLPTGAATAAKQDTGNASLSSIDSKLTTLPAGSNIIGKVRLVTATGDEVTDDASNCIGIIQTDPAKIKVTEASAADIKTALQIIDNFISGSRGLVTEDNSNAIKTALEAIENTAGIKKITDALPAGTNLLGKTGIDQTTPGTTNAVAVKDSTGVAISSSNPLPTQQSGVTVIPMPVSLDDLNASGNLPVKVNEALPTGTNSIGQVTANAGTNLNTSALATQATLASIKDTDGIKKITDALPAGTNLLGKTGIDQTTDGTTNKVSLSTDVLYTNFPLEVARGRVSGITQINKFGEAPNGIQTTATDIWTRADATPTQQIWLAPTAARVHAIASTSDNDGKTGAPTSTGARTIRVYGLTSWSSAETNEDVTLDGTTNVNTVNSYVIIHRMKVLTCGTSGPNVGTISATAATDATVTAVIGPGDGQTEMAIYGVPSTQSFYLTRWSVGIDKASGAAATADFILRVNENPNVQTTAFLRKDDISVQSTGNNHVERLYGNPVKFAGPCIVKVQGIASSADLDGHAGFDAYIVTN